MTCAVLYYAVRCSVLGCAETVQDVSCSLVQKGLGAKGLVHVAYDVGMGSIDTDVGGLFSACSDVQGSVCSLLSM
jgi:hypothetical protein